MGFPIVSQWKLSVAMATTVLMESAPNLKRKACPLNWMNSSFPGRWSFSYLKMLSIPLCSLFFQVPHFSLDQVVSDIRQFHSLYGQEHSLSGRAIARIFHGIASPCFPATTWGRVRRFWRSHLNVDFNELMKIATKELIGLRWKNTFHKHTNLSLKHFKVLQDQLWRN